MSGVKAAKYLHTEAFSEWAQRHLESNEHNGQTITAAELIRKSFEVGDWTPTGDFVKALVNSGSEPQQQREEAPKTNAASAGGDFAGRVLRRKEIGKSLTFVDIAAYRSGPPSSSSSTAPIHAAATDADGGLAIVDFASLDLIANKTAHGAYAGGVTTVHHLDDDKSDETKGLLGSLVIVAVGRPSKVFKRFDGRTGDWVPKAGGPQSATFKLDFIRMEVVSLVTLDSRRQIIAAADNDLRAVVIDAKAETQLRSVSCFAARLAVDPRHPKSLHLTISEPRNREVSLVDVDFPDPEDKTDMNLTAVSTVSKIGTRPLALQWVGLDTLLVGTSELCDCEEGAGPKCPHRKTMLFQRTFAEEGGEGEDKKKRKQSLVERKAACADLATVQHLVATCAVVAQDNGARCVIGCCGEGEIVVLQ